MKKWLMVLLLVVFASGCGTVPRSPICTWNLHGSRVIYFEQSDRIPKQVMLEACKNSHPTNIMLNANMAIPPELITSIAKEVLAVIPELSKTYSQERINEGLIGRRILIRGYNGVDELHELNDIIKSLETCFEKWTK